MQRNAGAARKSFTTGLDFTILPDMSEKGIFITFEGCEGSGKTSQMRALADFFASRGRECVLTREPGGTALSERIRELLLTSREGEGMSPRAELLLFEAARAQHVDELIRPALAAGKVVVSDRFSDSTLAYQGAARSLGDGIAEAANDIAVAGCMPDLTILLDMDAAEGLARARLRDGGAADRMGSEKLEFYRAVREAYLRLAELHPERIAAVDASGGIGEVAERIRRIVEGRFHV